MTKIDLINIVASKTGLTKKDTKALVDANLEVITEALAKGDNVQFIGFGTFEVVARAARTARVPSTGATVEVPAKKAVRFKVGQILKNSIRN